MRPDRIVYSADGKAYLKRWHILRTRWGSIYLHKILRSDERVLHDHPGWNVSIILSGGYIEVTPQGSFMRRAGNVIFRRAIQPHRLNVVQPVWTLFVMGPVSRQWGFHCSRGWTPATERELCGEETR